MPPWYFSCYQDRHHRRCHLWRWCSDDDTFRADVNRWMRPPAPPHQMDALIELRRSALQGGECLYCFNAHLWHKPKEGTCLAVRLDSNRCTRCYWLHQLSGDRPIYITVRLQNSVYARAREVFLNRPDGTTGQLTNVIYTTGGARHSRALRTAHTNLT